MTSSAEPPTCASCGSINTGTRFCTACGAEFVAPSPPENTSGSTNCPVCGTPIVPGDRFCTACGAAPDPVSRTQPIGQAASLESTPATFPPPAPRVSARDEYGGRRRIVLVGGLLGVLLLATAGFGSYFLIPSVWGRDGGSENRASPDNDEPDDSGTSASASPSASTSPSEVITPTVECWNGAVVAKAAECSQPTGEAGLQWVFPSFHPDECLERPRALPATG